MDSVTGSFSYHTSLPVRTSCASIDDIESRATQVMIEKSTTCRMMPTTAASETQSNHKGVSLTLIYSCGVQERERGTGSGHDTAKVRAGIFLYKINHGILVTKSE
jgi:hypothetical protein